MSVERELARLRRSLAWLRWELYVLCFALGIVVTVLVTELAG